MTETAQDQQSWFDVALLFSLFPFTQVKVLSSEIQPLLFTMASQQFKEFILLYMNWSFFQWTEKQSINMFEVMNKAFNFPQDKKIFFFKFKPRFEMVKKLSALLMVEFFFFRFQEM